MSAMQHTPGEWTYDPSDMCVYNDIGTGVCKIHRHAKVDGVDDLNSFGPSIETQANAALICVSPELVTRLYNLKNAVETTMSVLKCSPEVSMCLIEANETLKKVIE